MKIAANISVLFRELPLLERFAAARAAGFDGVEMQSPDASPRDLAAAAAGMPTALINGPILRETYPFGIAGRPEMRDVFRDQLPLIRSYAAALGVRQVHLLAGTVTSADDLDACWSTYADNLDLAADFLGREGVDVLIEPLNSTDMPNYLLHSFDDAHAVIERCGHRIGLQFDAFHAARMGLDPAAELARRLPIVRHVQFADAPGRHEPGTGNTDFAPFLTTLQKSGYAGWLSAEYSPLGPTGAGLRWLDDWRNRLARSPA
jgi:hydroxypyruvate isomerase